ncbi:MAG: YtxH domain-containing protein [Armatimonadetes bacterium]|nr:YtxH domain-containing protein [Armatimonadota bacterium]
MSNNEEKSVVLNFLAGIGIGVIVGAATALMLAPQSGTETREDLKKAMQDLTKSTEELRKRSTELLDVAKERARQAYETGREGVQKRLSKETGEQQASEEA